MQIQFSIDGQIELSRVLRGIQSSIQDFTPALSQSSEDLIEIFSYDNFESEGGTLEAPWAPLSAAYAKRKERLYPGAGILVATGLMQSSFTGLIDSTSLIIGNTAEYFKYHQSSGPRSRLPRRIMMRLTENMKETVVKNFQTQIYESVA